MTDPMEAIVAEALSAGGYEFTTGEGGGNKAGLDFHLTGPDLHIEVKRFHSDRIAAQLGRVENAIALQGEVAVRFFAGLVEAAHAVRAPLALTAVTDDLVALGVDGIQRRDAEGWGDEDEDQINRELARAVLVAVLEQRENTSDALRRIVPAGLPGGRATSGRAADWVRRAMRFIDLCEADVLDYADNGMAVDAEGLTRDGYQLFGIDIDHTDTSLADIEHAKLALDEDGVACGMVLAASQLADMGEDTIAADILEACGRTTREKVEALGLEDYDLDILTPIFAAIGKGAEPDPRWTLGNGKPWTRDDSTTFDVIGLVGEIELEIPTRPEHAGTVFERLNAGRNVRRLTVKDIAAWTDDQVRDAELWAGAIHLNASDNDDVEIPPTPEHLLPWLERKAL